MTLDERIKAILPPQIQVGPETFKEYDAAEPYREQVKQLIREVIEEVKPGRVYYVEDDGTPTPVDAAEIDRMHPYMFYRIDDLEDNVKRLGL